ncbi:MAG: chemotaxis protein CheW [Vulcanimicrobiota bacterium]
MLLHFLVAGQPLALPLKEVREVLLLPELLRTPNRPPFLEGVLNLAGTAVPVIRLSRLLQLPDKELEPYDHILLLHRGYGLLVDSVQKMQPREEGTAIPLPPSLSFNQCLAECLQVGDSTLAVLSEEKLLLWEERQRLEEFGKLEQERLAAVKPE